MKRILLSTALLATLGAGSAALASETCTTPRSERQSQEALQQKLEAEGWTVRKIEVDDGCYEVYGVEPGGKRVEAYFDPKTFALVELESED